MPAPLPPVEAPARRLAHTVAILAAFAAGAASLAFCAVVASDRGVGNGFETLLGFLLLYFSVASLTGAGTFFITMPGQPQIILGAGDRSRVGWTVRAMRGSMSVLWLVVGGLLIARALGAVSTAALERAGAAAMVPMFLAFAALRWMARAEFAAALAQARKQAQRKQTITIAMPKPSRKLTGALSADIARHHPALHALLSLGTAAFLLLVAVSPSVAEAVRDLITYPWRLIDGAFSDVVHWVLDLF